MMKPRALWRQAERPAVEDIVRRAWMETLPDQAFDPSLSWEESGADSIASLHLLLRLERALGRKLPFDLLSPEMTASDLVRSLQDMPPSMSGACSLVFLVPGIYGDEPVLAGFRRSFAGRIQFHLLELPDIESAAAILTDMAAIARDVARQIENRQPAGKIYLTGFSFGGVVAYEAARHLIGRGRQVAFIGLLDAGVDEGTLKFFLVNDRGPVSRMLHDAIAGAAVVLCAGDKLRRLIFLSLGRHSPDAALQLRRLVLRRFRLRAVQGWVLAPLPAQHGPAAHILLAATEQFAPMTVAKWTEVCAGLQVVICAGKHHDVLGPTAVAALNTAFDTASMPTR